MSRALDVIARGNDLVSMACIGDLADKEGNCTRAIPRVDAIGSVAVARVVHRIGVVFFHAVAAVVHFLFLRVAFFYVEKDVDTAGIFKDEGGFFLIALFERGVETHEHNMQATGFEGNGLARRDENAAHLMTHLHDAVVHLALVDHRVWKLGFDSNQTVGRVAVIGNDHIARTRRRTGRGREAHGVVDGNLASLELVGEGSMRGQRGDGRNKRGFEKGHRCLPFGRAKADRASHLFGF